jgi:hypothetical protein
MQDGTCAPHVPTHAQQDGTNFSRVPQSSDKGIHNQDGINHINVPCDTFQNPEMDGFPEAPHGILNPLFNLDSIARSQTPSDLESLPALLDHLQSTIELLKPKIKNLIALQSLPFRPSAIPITSYSKPTMSTKSSNSSDHSQFSKIKTLFTL